MVSNPTQTTSAHDALVTNTGTFRRKITRRSIIGFFAASIVLSALGIKVWHAFCLFKNQAWNDVRLRPSFILADGLALYPGMENGPITTWMYGPAHPVIMLPVTWAHDYLTCLNIGAALNITLWIVPLLLSVYYWPSSVAIHSRSERALLALTACLLIPANYLIFTTADATCFAAASLSILCLGYALTREKHDTALFWLAALLVSTAAFAKPHGVFVALGHILHLWSRAHRTVALRQTWRMLLAFLLWSLVSLLVSAGPVAFWQHVFALPGMLPWAPHPLNQLATHPGWIVGAMLVPALLAVTLIWRKRLEIDALPALCFVLVMPFGVAAFLKFGGNTNSIHAALYLTPCLLSLFSTRIKVIGHKEYGVCAFAACAGLIALFIAPPPLKSPLEAAALESKLLAQNAPDEMWLPWRPLASYLASGKQCHDEDGLFIRNMIGRPPSPALLRSGQPKNWKITAMEHTSMRWWSVENGPPATVHSTYGRWDIYYQAN